MRVNRYWYLFGTERTSRESVIFKPKGSQSILTTVLQRRAHKSSNSSTMSKAYVHQHQSGAHYDVLKNVVYIAAARRIQEEHPDGVVFVETHSGPGVYDVVSEEYHKGAERVVAKNLEAPPPVKKYVSLLNKLRKEFGEGTLPGTPLFTRELMRETDQHRLCDLHEEDVEGLFEDAQFRQLDAYDPASLDYILPTTETLHPIILLDPPYDDGMDWSKAKDLFGRILDRKPDATVIMWMPFARDDRNRWSFPTAMKALCKDKASIGRYFASIVVAKDGLEGGAMIVANPTKDLDDIVTEECLSWMAATMHQGKADYAIEQAMKKKKKVVPM